MFQAVWNKLNLSKKLMLSVIGVALCTGVGISYVIYSIAYENLLWEMDKRNQVVAQNMNFSFRKYIAGRAEELEILSKFDHTYQIFTDLEKGWLDIPEQNRKAYFKDLYINKNPFSEEERYKLSKPEGIDTLYTQGHQSMHKDMAVIQDNHIFKDIYMVTKKGDVIYSINKEDDFAENVISGSYADTGLGHIVQDVIKGVNSGNTIYFSGFQAHIGSTEKVLYLAKPLFDEKKEFLGVLVGEMNMENAFARANIEGLDDTVTYIVDEKNQEVLTDILSTPEPDFKSNKALSPELFKAIINPEIVARGKGIVYEDAYLQSNASEIGGKKITLISERDALSFEDDLLEMKIYSFGALCLFLLGASVVAILIARSLSKPILNLNHSVKAMLEGKEVYLHEKERGDEIGNLAGTLEAVYEAGQAAQKVQIALDNAQSPLMMLDKELKVSYVNQSLVDTMTKSQDHIRQNYPSVNLSKMVGTPFAAFHPHNTQNYVGRISGMSAYQIVPLRLGNRSFDVGVTPVNNARGERVGYISEWVEKTKEYLSQKEKEAQLEKEKEIEAEISKVISVVAKGNFSARLKLNDNRPFIQSIANNINDLCGVVEGFINTASNSLQAVSMGDLTQSIKGQYEGRLAEMQDALNSTIHQLSSTIDQIANLGHTIRSASGDIASGAEDLSSRTESQAASIQETVATMEEMAASVRMNADNANKANTLSREALQQAKTGGNVVNQAVGAMKELESSAIRITEIVNVIDSIASQTNLLALNAAVEAARAGEAGKGFAVVASEVRSLASRCADAAHDIRALISQSNSQVSEGVKLVNATGESLMAIVGAVENVAQTVSAISSASREQATGVEEISNTINQMDEMTQQNASLSDESAAASRNLLGQVSELSELVNYFKTGSNSGVLSRTGKILQKERHQNWG